MCFNWNISGKSKITKGGADKKSIVGIICFNKMNNLANGSKQIAVQIPESIVN